MQRKVLPWIFTVLILIIIIAGTRWSFGLVSAAICIALIADLYVVRISLIEMRIRLARQGLELGQVIPSTLVIFGWLIYAVVHFQIFLAIVYFLELTPGFLKWVFPLTAIKALWPVYYLGSKLPEKRQLHNSLQSIVFQLPWAIGGGIIWWHSNSTAESNLIEFAWSIILVVIAISPGLLSTKFLRD